MKKYNINKISSYFSILEENDISSYIYRGQNEPYFSIGASGFRPYQGGWDSDKIYDMEYLRSTFYNRIIGQISESEKKHFLAFCQHHGIPTNLVDMSFSPLVALFFACDGKSELNFSLSDLIGNETIENLEQDTSLQKKLIHNLINRASKTFHSPFAQVYMIKKERLIDITDIIIRLKGKNLFEELLTDEELALNLFELIKIHFKSINIDTLKVWIKNLLKSYIEICELHESIISSELLYNKVKNILSHNDEFNIQDYEELSEVFTESSLIKSTIKTLFSLDTMTFNSPISNTAFASIYTALMIEIFGTLKNLPRKINLELDIYFTYQPPELFGRISSQQSFFIYQPYVYTNDGVYDYYELNVQSIIPDIIIEIDNYQKILYELNILGINNGTIYGDFDNIAKAILRSPDNLIKG